MHVGMPTLAGRPRTHRGLGTPGKYMGLAEWRDQFPFRHIQPGLWQELEPFIHLDGDTTVTIVSSGPPMVLFRATSNCRTGTCCQEPDLYTTLLSTCTRWEVIKPPRGMKGYWPEWCSGMRLRISAEKREAGRCTP